MVGPMSINSNWVCPYSCVEVASGGAPGTVVNQTDLTDDQWERVRELLLE